MKLLKSVLFILIGFAFVGIHANCNACKKRHHPDNISPNKTYPWYISADAFLQNAKIQRRKKLIQELDLIPAQPGEDRIKKRLIQSLEAGLNFDSLEINRCRDIFGINQQCPPCPDMNGPYGEPCCPPPTPAPSGPRDSSRHIYPCIISTRPLHLQFYTAQERDGCYLYCPLPEIASCPQSILQIVIENNEEILIHIDNKRQ